MQGVQSSPVPHFAFCDVLILFWQGLGYAARLCCCSSCAAARACKKMVLLSQLCSKPLLTWPAEGLLYSHAAECCIAYTSLLGPRHPCSLPLHHMVFAASRCHCTLAGGAPSLHAAMRPTTGCYSAALLRRLLDMTRTVCCLQDGDGKINLAEVRVCSALALLLSPDMWPLLQFSAMIRRDAPSAIMHAVTSQRRRHGGR